MLQRSTAAVSCVRIACSTSRSAGPGSIPGLGRGDQPSTPGRRPRARGQGRPRPGTRLALTDPHDRSQCRIGLNERFLSPIQASPRPQANSASNVSSARCRPQFLQAGNLTGRQCLLRHTLVRVRTRYTAPNLGQQPDCRLRILRPASPPRHLANRLSATTSASTARTSGAEQITAVAFDDRRRVRQPSRAKQSDAPEASVRAEGGGVVRPQRLLQDIHTDALADSSKPNAASRVKSRRGIANGGDAVPTGCTGPRHAPPPIVDRIPTTNTSR